MKVSLSYEARPLALLFLSLIFSIIFCPSCFLPEIKISGDKYKAPSPPYLPADDFIELSLREHFGI